MQAAGGVDEHDVAPARAGSLERVECHRGRVAAPRRADEVRPGPLSPDLELLLRGRSERVRRADEHGPAVLGELHRELPDRRRLAGPVHADDEHDRRAAGQVEARRAAEERLYLLDETILEPARGSPELEPADELGRRRDADVAADERLLEPLPRIRVGRVERGLRELLGERAPALRERVAHAGEHACALRLVRGGRLVAEQLGPGQAHENQPMRPCYAAELTAARASSRGSLRETTCETPSGPMVTP